MATGSKRSVREYRELIIEQMPPWMEVIDFDLLNYFSLSGHSYTQKLESIIIDGTEYIDDEWTIGELKTELSIAGTGNYDICTIGIIEKIDEDDNVFVYTNPNLIQIDALAVIQKKIDDRKDLVTTEMNPRLATVDGLLPFWEAIFQSTRQTIDGQLETDAAYMARAVSELFGISSSLIAIRQVFEKYGLTNFTLVDSRKDTFKWNSFSEADSVNLHLEVKDIGRIPFLEQAFIDVSLAGMRLFVFVDGTGYGSSYGSFYGNS